MEKANLTVIKTKKGTFIVKAVFESKKEITIQNFTVQDMSLNGKAVEVERDKGQVVKIVMEGKEIFTLQKPAIAAAEKNSLASQSLHLNHTDNIPDPARAPYNFVPLNDIVIPAKETPCKDFGFDKYHEGKYTGYIGLNIETKMPLYIRDTLNEAEMRQADEAEKRGEKFINSDFFSPAGKIRTPGSSLRGMIRTMVEMVSFGKFRYFYDRRLYFRAVADTSKLGSDYKSIMVDEGNNYFPKIKAGIFKKVNQSYVVYPSKSLPAGSNGTQIYRINFDKNTKIVAGTTSFKVPVFEFREIYFYPVTPKDHTHRRWDRRENKEVTYLLRYAKLTSVSQTKDSKHSYRGFIVASGEFGNKKHMHWVVNEPENKFIKIEEGVIEIIKMIVHGKIEQIYLKS